MKFDVFDKAEQEKYTAEVKEKWGNTIAYQEYQQHEKGGSTGTPADLMRHFAKLGKLKHLAPTAPEAQAAIAGTPVRKRRGGGSYDSSRRSAHESHQRNDRSMQA